MLEHLRQHVAARTAQSKASASEIKTPIAAQANGTPGTSKQVDTPVSTPKLMLTLEGKLAQKPMGGIGNKPSIIAKKNSPITTVVTSANSPSAAGIVTKVLSSNTTRVVTTSAMSQLFSPDPVKVAISSAPSKPTTSTQSKPTTSTQSKPVTIKPKGPQVFSSTSSKSTPDPSLPILLVEEDM